MTVEREGIVAELQPLDFDAVITSSVITAYWKFYGIDFSQSIEGVEQTIGTVKSGGFEICCNVFTPTNSVGTCFVVHGYLDHTGLYGHLIKKLLKLNYKVVAIDLPGHGLSSGLRAEITSFTFYENALQAVLEKSADLTKPWHGIGQSTGCSVLLMNLIKRPELNFDKTVLFAPLIRPNHWYKGKFLHPILSLFKDEWPRYFSPNSHDKKFLSFVKNADSFQSQVLPFTWLKAMRQWVGWILKQKQIASHMLVLQGGEDATVDGEFNIKALEKRVTNIQVSHHLEARHHLVNESAEIRDVLFAEMDRFLSS